MKLQIELQKTAGFFTYYFKGLYQRLDQSHVFLTAGGLAFSLFTCIVPFMLIIFSLLGRLLEIPNVQQQINLFIDTAIPYEQSAQWVKEVVYNRIDEFRHYRFEAGWLGGVGLLIAASGLFSSMRTILNSIYGVSRSRHVIIGKLRDLGMVALVLLFFLFSMFLFPALETVKGFLEKIRFLSELQIGLLEKELFSLLSLSVMFGIFYMLYSFVSYEKLQRKVVAASALWAALLWEIAKRLFGYYLAHIAALNRIYGAYLFLIIVAFWIYYSSIAFIIGGHIGQLYRERKKR